MGSATPPTHQASSSYDFCKQALAGEMPTVAGESDWLRPLMERYVLAVDNLRNIAKWAHAEDAPSDAQHTLDQIGE